MFKHNNGTTLLDNSGLYLKLVSIMPGLKVAINILKLLP